MTPEEVREIVRDEIAKMLAESGLLPEAMDFMIDTLSTIPFVGGRIPPKNGDAAAS